MKGETQRNPAPFLNWAGGKRWLVQKHASLLPLTYSNYIEPFLGAGSVFFHMQPRKSILSDLNADLIAAYQGIREDPQGVVASLRYRQRIHNKDDDYYYRLRARVPQDPIQRATRMIYLNRTCFNGIYRVNLNGNFNVPRGSKSKVCMSNDDFPAIARLLKNADLRVCDFEDSIDVAKAGDFVFADPPYTVRHNLNGFVKYNEILFSWADQERLAFALQRAARRGAKVLSTNANHKSVLDLYSSTEFAMRVVSRCSRISSDATTRGAFNELFLTANV